MLLFSCRKLNSRFRCATCLATTNHDRIKNSETDSELDMSHYDAEDHLNAYSSPVFVPPNKEQVDNILTNVHAHRLSIFDILLNVVAYFLIFTFFQVL